MSMGTFFGSLFPDFTAHFKTTFFYEQAPGHQILPHPMLEALQAMLLFFLLNSSM